MKSDTDFRLLDVYYLYTLYIQCLGEQGVRILV